MDARGTVRASVRAALGPRWPLTVGALAAVGGGLVLWVALTVFPYHSLNHDEGVYLQQAAMLLDGTLFLQPPVQEAFRPWFFVESAAGLYPKYAPVPAAMFAPGVALGIPRLALGAIGAGIVALVTLLGAELFDRPTGLLAGVIVVASPLFVVDTAVFLPYAPTTFLNLGFAVAYLRADRTGSRGLAAIAGVSVGLAFFARPYTAVLFAVPFVAHALWTMRTRDRDVLIRQSITAALGLVGVALTLGYNAVLTGSPLVFPYQAFAPHDGLGFGYHEILGHERDYTPALALAANRRVLVAYASQWVAAGVLGTLLALVGLAATLYRRVDARRLALAGIVFSVTLGELYFWGTLNMLGALEDPTDGLINYLGSYYHFDLLVPTAVFGAVGVLAIGRRVWAVLDGGLSMRWASAVGASLLVASTLVAGGAAVVTVQDALAENAAVTDHYEAAYEPFEDRPLNDALVFLPEPYGPWLNHPFQHLRNDPAYEGDPVFALAERQFAVTEAFPERSLYRYRYRGQWTPTVGSPVEATLQRVRQVDGQVVRVEASAGVPESAELVSIRLESGVDVVRYTVSDPPSTLSLTLSVEDGRAVLSGPQVDEPVGLAVENRDLLSQTLFVDYGRGAGFSYEIDTPIRATSESVRALTPTLEYCRVAHLCNGRAAYVPGTMPENVFLNATVRGGSR